MMNVAAMTRTSRPEERRGLKRTSLPGGGRLRRSTTAAATFIGSDVHGLKNVAATTTVAA
jgi:hypothetical protein